MNIKCFASFLSPKAAVWPLVLFIIDGSLDSRDYMGVLLKGHSLLPMGSQHVRAVNCNPNSTQEWVISSLPQDEEGGFGSHPRPCAIGSGDRV